MSDSPPYPKAVLLAFTGQSRSAQNRGIAFEFTIKEWWEWWQTDNRWANRGRGRDKLVMARYNDEGPYKPSNTYCATGSQNIIDAGRRSKHRAAMAKWRDKRATREQPPCMPRASVSVTDAQASWLRSEAKRIGITVGELLRRLIDRVREAA